MKVLDVSLWLYGKDCLNSHDLQILVDKIPEDNELRFHRKDGLYYAEKDGYVKYFYWSGKGNDGGFYGREFEITMKDGSKVILKGPWSSRCSVMNKYFKNCIEVSITDDPEAFKRGYTFMAGAITVELAREVLEKFLPEWTIVRVEKWGEIEYKIVRKDDLEDKRDNEFFRKFFEKAKERGNTRYVRGDNHD